MLLVQQYLLNNSLLDLQKTRGVYARLSSSGHKFSLNYDQIEAKESDPLAQECRGLILAAKNGRQFSFSKEEFLNTIPGPTQIISFPFKRFFNFGQGAAFPIDLSKEIFIQEKLDGTQCSIYYDPFTYEWCCSTRSVPDADLPINDSELTFRLLFEKALLDSHNISFNEFTSLLNATNTYMFELTTPYNRIVVDYPISSITLLAVRSLNSLKELDPANEEIVKKWNIPIPEIYSLKNIKQIIDWVGSRNPSKHEGVVIRDSNFNRIKVKNPGYVILGRAKDNILSSEKNCIELILSEKEDDVMSILSEEAVNKILNLKEKLIKMLHYHDEQYLLACEETTNNNPGDKKTFAQIIVVKEKLWVSPLFQIFDGKALSTKDFILKNKKNGTWSNSFLDKVLEHCNNF
jgi:hypothetical protein